MAFLHAKAILKPIAAIIAKRTWRLNSFLNEREVLKIFIFFKRKGSLNRFRCLERDFLDFRRQTAVQTAV